MLYMCDRAHETGRVFLRAILLPNVAHHCHVAQTTNIIIYTFI